MRTRRALKASFSSQSSHEDTGGESDDDDDTRSISTFTPYELERVEEEDEEQLLQHRGRSPGIVQELQLVIELDGSYVHYHHLALLCNLATLLIRVYYRAEGISRFGPKSDDV